MFSEALGYSFSFSQELVGMFLTNQELVRNILQIIRPLERLRVYWHLSLMLLKIYNDVSLDEVSATCRLRLRRQGEGREVVM
jgi:hypothetical protein